MCLVDLCYPLQIALQQGAEGTLPEVRTKSLFNACQIVFYSIPIQEVDMHRLMFVIVNIVR